MAQSLDSLCIEITASCGNAVKSINSLSRSLSKLSSTISGIDTSNLSKLSSALGGVSTGFNAIKSSNAASNITKISNALNGVTNASSGISNTASAIKQVTTNSVNAQRSMQNFNVKGFASLGSQVNNLASAFKKVNIPIEQATQNAKSFKQKLVGMKIVVPTGNFQKVNKDIEKVKYEYEKLRNLMSQKVASGGYVDNSAYLKDQKKLEGLRQSYKDLLLEQERLSREGGNVKLNTEGVDKFKRSLKDVKGVIGNVLNQFKKVSSVIGGVFSASLIPVKAFTKALGSIRPKTSLASRGLKSLESHTKKLFKSLTRISKMLRLMIVRKILQAVIKNAITGFNNVAVYSDKFNSSVSLLWNSLRQTGNAIGAMVSPLVNALAPALNMIMQQIIQLINWFNQLFSALTGATTWLKAKTLTDSYADSLDSAGKSAKKLNKQLQGFDALNNLTTSDSDNSTSALDMFEEVATDSNIKKISDWLKEMWDIGDFYDLGAKLGKKFRDWLNSIPWGKINKSAKKLGKVFATLINGFTNVEGLGYSMGRALAKALNSVFEFVNSFVHNLDWKALGTFIADTFNGFFENIDWKLIKDTVITGIKGLATSINAFITDFRWNNISRTISNLVNTLSEAIYTFFSEVKWDELGTKLGEQLRNTIENIDWVMVGKALGSIVKAAIDFVGSFIKEQDFESVKNAIKDTIDGFFEYIDPDGRFDPIKDALTNFCDTITPYLQGVVDIGKDFYKNFLAKLSEWALGDGLNHLSDVLKDLDEKGFIKNVKDALNDLWDVLEPFAETVGEGLILFIEDVGNALNDFLVSDNWKEFVDSLKEWTSNISARDVADGLKLIAEALVAYKTFVVLSSVFNALMTFLTFIKTSGEAVAKGGQLIATSILGIKDALATVSAFMVSPQWASFVMFLENPASIVSISNIIDLVRGTCFDPDEWEGIVGKIVDWIGILWNNLVLAIPKGIDSLFGTDIVGDNWQTFEEYNDAVKKLQEAGKSTRGTYDDIIWRAKQLGEETKESYSKVADNIDKVGGTLQVTAGATKDFANAMKNTSDKIKDTSDEIKKSQEPVKQYAENWRNVKEDATSSIKGVKDKSQDLSAWLKSDDAIPKYTQNGSNAFKGMDEQAKKSLGNLENQVTLTEKTVANETSKMNFEVTGEMQSLTKGVSDNTNKIKTDTDSLKKSFSADKWTMSGIKEGLSATFNSAINAIKNIWGRFIDWINEKLKIKIDTSSIIGKGLAEILGSATLTLGQLPKFATGGFPENGLFMANSSEMVGKFSNGKTAVANNEQIIDGIARGVASAESEQNALLRQQNALLQAILEKDTGISADGLFRSVQTSASNYYKRTGRYAFD